MNKLKIVSYWVEPNSKSSFYETSAKTFLKRTKGLDLDVHIENIEPQYGGTYWGNTLYKPFFIKKCLEMFPDKPILWLDIDTSILKKLTTENLPMNSFDVGLIEKNKATGLPWYGGCQLWQHTKESYNLLDRIIEFTNTPEHRGSDHQILCRAATIKDSNWKTFDLPWHGSHLLFGSAPKHIVLK